MPNPHARILLAEDEWLIRAEMRHILEEAGHQVIAEAETAADAVAMAKACRPNLCILDIMLADGSSGIEAAEEIIGHVGVPVLLVSGMSNPPFVVPYLRKPFTREEFLDLVHKMLAPRTKSLSGLLEGCCSAVV